MIALAMVAALANEAGSQSRRGGAPVLSADSSLETLRAWLAWNDPNGDYLDDARCEAEGYVPLTLDSAWDLIKDSVS